MFEGAYVGLQGNTGIEICATSRTRANGVRNRNRKSNQTEPLL